MGGERGVVVRVEVPGGAGRGAGVLGEAPVPPAERGDPRDGLCLNKIRPVRNSYSGKKMISPCPTNGAGAGWSRP